VSETTSARGWTRTIEPVVYKTTALTN